MESGLAWAAVAVPAVAALFVAWQAWEVRRSVAVAQEALSSADEALALSRKHVAEAVRSRIDASMPQLEVTVGSNVRWPPLEPSAYHGGEPQPLGWGAGGRQWFMPRDGSQLIRVEGNIDLVNRSATAIQLTTTPLTTDGVADVAQPLRLEPGEQFSGRYWVERTLATWVEVFERRERGNAGDEANVELVYIDPSDTGAIDNWTVRVGGTPIDRIPGIDGGWRLADGPQSTGGGAGLGIGMPIRHRRYWLSRQNDIPLDD